MALGDGGDDALAAAVGGEALLELCHGGRGAGKVAFVDNDEVRGVEHGDLLQLETAAVLGAHDEDRFVHEPAAEGERFLADADGLDEDYVEGADGGQRGADL